MTHKKGILLVSFGTSYLDSKAKTIDRILSDVTTAFPNYHIYQAFSSNIILRILKTRDNLYIPSLEEAMTKIISDGIEQLIVQPTHLINGLENEAWFHIIQKQAPSTLPITFGAPLLNSTEDHKAVLKAVLCEFSDIPSEDVIVFMGHGTTHYANSVYAALDYMLKEMGHPNIFMGTVEAYPDLNTLLHQMPKTSATRVHLIPFMLVAGDHANNDMAGDSPNSWKSLFETAGYEVICHLRGLGEYQGIRDIYLEHLQKAICTPAIYQNSYQM